LLSKPARNAVNDWALIFQLVVGGIGLLLLLAVNLLFILARQRSAEVNVAAARRLNNASELIGVVLAWLLALCTISSAVYGGLQEGLNESASSSSKFVLWEGWKTQK